MLDLLCPYCGATEGRCSAKGAGHFINECKACGRVIEERRSEFVELFVDRAQDSPLCIVTPDISENKCYRAPPLDDDPFESIGLITAFSTWSLESVPLFTATSTSFSGQLAELEHKLSVSLQSQDEVINYGPQGASLNMPDLLRAYFQILEVSSVLGLERDSCDHAIQLFRDCSLITILRNRNIEALATAALVQAIREAQEARTLQEISLAANIPQKEIGRHMKVLSDSLKLSQPINSNSLAMHMPRFCNLLQLSKTTEDLATHIGEVVLNKCFCTRRNPISISAAAIYLSCQLEDKKRTQTEICKTTGLTEVTLRKVYKELLENLEDLLPADYNPAVSPVKAFPVTSAGQGRVCATRAPTGLDSHFIRDLSPAVWPSHVVYNIPPLRQRLEEEESPKAAEGGFEECSARPSSPLKGHLQDTSILPGVRGSVTGLQPTTLQKVSQLMSSEPVENLRSEKNLQLDVCEGDRTEKRNREHKGDESSDSQGRSQHSPFCFSTAHMAVSASGLGRPPAFAGFSPGIWPCANPASNSTYFEMIPRQVIATPGHPPDTDPYTGESEVANCGSS